MSPGENGDVTMGLHTQKLTNGLQWPRHSIVRGFASLIDFTSSDAREYTERILARSNEDAIRADWEVVGTALQRAIDSFNAQYEELSQSE